MRGPKEKKGGAEGNREVMKQRGGDGGMRQEASRVIYLSRCKWWEDRDGLCLFLLKRSQIADHSSGKNSRKGEN